MHDLIKENQAIKEHDFGIETPPILHPNKGVWVPRTTISPDYNPAAQIKTGPVKTVNEDSTTWTYAVTDKPAPIPLTAEEIKAQALQALDTEKTARLTAGFDVNGVWFDSDTNAEIRYMQLATKFQSDPTFVKRWKAADNVWVDMDATLFASVVAAFEAHISGVYEWLEAEQEALNDI